MYGAQQNKLYVCFVDLEKGFNGIPKGAGMGNKKKGTPEVSTKPMMSLHNEANISQG